MFFWGAYEVLNYRITVEFFQNYRNTVIKCLFEYRHCSIFYQKLYFPVTVRWLTYRIPSISYSNHRITTQKIGKYRTPSYRAPNRFTMPFSFLSNDQIREFIFFCYQKGVHSLQETHDLLWPSPSFFITQLSENVGLVFSWIVSVMILECLSNKTDENLRDLQIVFKKNRSNRSNKSRNH